MKKVLINKEKTSNNIIALMIENKVDEKKLQEVLGLKTNFKVRKLLDGRSVPTLEETVSLCNFFNVNIGDLIEYCILD